ncbi:MAG: DUF308 domain-containing protein [Bacilli bacterium]
MQNTKEKIIRVVFNIFLGLAGFVFLNDPQLGIDFIRYYLAIVLIVVAIIPFLVYHFSKVKDKREVVKGILLILVGLFFLISEKGSELVFGIALIIWMASTSFLRFAIAFKYKKVFNQNWWLMLLFGVIALGFAIYITLNISQSLNILIGIGAFFMIIDASIKIIETILFKPIVPTE